MSFNFTRRRFLGWSQAAAAAMFTSGAPTLANAETSSNDDYYDKLGVDKIINAAGTYTYLTASIMPPPVQRAVAQAALHPVFLEDLQKKAGEYLDHEDDRECRAGDVAPARTAGNGLVECFFHQVAVAAAVVEPVGKLLKQGESSPRSGCGTART